MIKVVGGFKQPIAKLPKNEEIIGHPAPANTLNPDLRKEMEKFLEKNVKKRKKK
jgi:hypothetical protein